MLKVDLSENRLYVLVALLLDVSEGIDFLCSCLELELLGPCLERFWSYDGVKGAPGAVHASLYRVLHVLRVVTRSSFVDLVRLQLKQHLVGLRLCGIDLGYRPIGAVQVLLTRVIIIVRTFVLLTCNQVLGVQFDVAGGLVAVAVSTRDLFDADSAQAGVLLVLAVCVVDGTQVVHVAEKEPLPIRI